MQKNKTRLKPYRENLGHNQRLTAALSERGAWGAEPAKVIEALDQNEFQIAPS